jgi:histidine ammonia-lyase
MSSNAASIGHAALVAVAAGRLLDAALEAAALSFLGRTPTGSSSTSACTQARPHPGQRPSPRGLRELLGRGRPARRAIGERARAKRTRRSRIPSRSGRCRRSRGPHATR